MPEDQSTSAILTPHIVMGQEDPDSPLYKENTRRLQFAPSCPNPFHRQGWYRCPAPMRNAASSIPPAGRGEGFLRYIPSNLAGGRISLWAERKHRLMRNKTQNKMGVQRQHTRQLTSTVGVSGGRSSFLSLTFFTFLPGRPSSPHISSLQNQKSLYNKMQHITAKRIRYPTKSKPSPVVPVALFVHVIVLNVGIF